jgi:hypothetical protein
MLLVEVGTNTVAKQLSWFTNAGQYKVSCE